MSSGPSIPPFGTETSRPTELVVTGTGSKHCAGATLGGNSGWLPPTPISTPSFLGV